ncbi:MAG: tetratricopeptide repeat protein [Pricia sp.]
MIFLFNLAVEAQNTAEEIPDSLYATGNYTKAINYYAEAGGEKASLQIARSYSAIGNWDKAIVQYQDVIERRPDWQIAGFELGKLLLKSKQYDKARKRFSRLAAADDYNPEYHYYLGELFQELDQPASSLTSY